MEDGRTKILLVSDSHGDLDALAAALKSGGTCDRAVFLGDGAADIESLSQRGISWPPLAAVKGNVDLRSSLPEALMMEECGLRILITHGHRQGVQHGLGGLVAGARISGAQAAFFGHTHHPCLGRAGGLILVNPGSLSRPRGPSEGSFAIVELGPEGFASADFFMILKKGRTLRAVPAPESFASKPVL